MPLRQEFDLYARIRPSQAYPGRAHALSPRPTSWSSGWRARTCTRASSTAVGEAATRELRELIRAHERHGASGRTRRSRSSGSRAARCRRLVEAFEYAAENGRRKVTAVHKANVMKQSDGRVPRGRAERSRAEHPEVEFDDRRVDSLCCELALRPGDFDVLVMPLFYGDFVSDLGAGLVGGLGMAPGRQHRRRLRDLRGGARHRAEAQGRNRVNPFAMILSGVMMLRHVGEAEAADRVERAIGRSSARESTVTYDLKPSGTTDRRSGPPKSRRQWWKRWGPLTTMLALDSLKMPARFQS